MKDIYFFKMNKAICYCTNLMFLGGNPAVCSKGYSLAGCGHEQTCMEAQCVVCRLRWGEVLTGKCRIFKRESGNVQGEDLYKRHRQDRRWTLPMVFFIRKLGNKALIITAREMNKREHMGDMKKVNRE